MILPIVCTVLVLVYILLNLALLMLRNHRAHQFFRTKSPNLPVLPNPSIIHGHYLNVIYPQKNWRIIRDLHKKLGPTFGYYVSDQAWVSTKDIDLLKLIEVDEAHKHINRCKLNVPVDEFANSIFQVDGDDWRRVRRAISPALTNHSVRSESVSSDIASVVEQMAESLRDKFKVAGEERSILIDVHDLALRYTLAIIFLVTYRREKAISFTAKNDPWVKAMEESGRQITNPLVILSMCVPFARPLCKFLIQFHPVGQHKARIVDFIIEATDIRRVFREHLTKKDDEESSPKGGDKIKRRLVDTFIDAFLDKRIKYEDFVGSTFFLLLAGFQTTADTITCLIWQLAQKPQIQERLREAIMREGIDAEYLRWCIMETIRWHPAVPLGTGRLIAEDITINGTFLAKGTFVMPSTHTIHHDPNIWPDADTFKPERWKEAATFHPAAFMGFGLGPRNCVGGKMAIHEIKLFMHLILTKYRIETCPGTTDRFDFSSPGLVYTTLDQPIKVRLVELADNL